MNDVYKQRLKILDSGKLPVNYKRNRGGLYPADWKVWELNEVLCRVKKPVDVKLDEKYKQIGIRSHGKGIFYKDSVTGQELGNKSVYWIEPECFIVNIVFAWEMAVGKTSEKEIGMIASHRFPMYKSKSDKIDIDYLTYFFKSQRGKYLLELASPGGAGRNKTLGQAEFLDIEIALPSIEEQSEIVRILMVWDSAIELKERLVEEKKRYKKGLMKKLVTGKMRLSGYDGKISELHFDDLFLKIQTKKHQLNSSEYLTEGRFPVIDQGKNKIVGYSNDADKVFRCPENGVIIFGDHTRELKFINFDFIIGADGTQVLVEKNQNNLRYLYYQLLNKDIPNNGYSRHFKFLKEMVFEVVDYIEQGAISSILALVDDEIVLLEKELEALKQQKKGLMRLLLTGIVRVNVETN